MIEDRVLYRRVWLASGEMRWQRMEVQIRYPGERPDELPEGGVSADAWRLSPNRSQQKREAAG